MEVQFLSLRQAYISDMSILLGLEPFQKLGVVVVGGGGKKAFQGSALVQTLDLELEAWTKLNKNNSRSKMNFWSKLFFSCYKIWVKKSFGLKKYFCQKHFQSKNIFCQKKILVKKNFGRKKSSNLKFLVKKKLWLEKVLGQNKFG